MPTDDGGLFQRYTEISWRFSKAKAETLPPHWSIAIDLEPDYNLAIWADLQFIGVELNGVGWSDIHTIAWIKITCSRGRIMDLDLKIPCHMDGSMSGYFLMMADMSPDGLWDCDEESMEDGHYGGQ